ncbi:hypothetical protein OAD22_03560 [Pseudomonadales bacterium]|jgi:hypothetical protein|uniref:Uncharacterized protein n=1 Tax=SAR86 cluster bacterium TaxID=2030880 RepID=A0A973A9F7_9GAMM|nr:hypothetical protein [Pseudomonadales bacterium]MDB4151633.1 hypothetical protein [Pseudomonadales bacterium]MDB9916836.1 hypothetical protein [Pseudomonadales bacterium]NQV64711.1 hypothetical protein [SAR86 cluster bacterium]|tara:strand:- start:3902 stop:4081 length:180 start_codon:yes stop_codon:yes gene_type:complete
MPLLLLSVILSMLLGGVIWLVIGSRLPIGSTEKFPALNNIAYYALMVFLPIFLTIFYTF